MGRTRGHQGGRWSTEKKTVYFSCFRALSGWKITLWWIKDRIQTCGPAAHPWKVPVSRCLSSIWMLAPKQTCLEMYVKSQKQIDGTSMCTRRPSDFGTLFHSKICSEASPILYSWFGRGLQQEGVGKTVFQCHTSNSLGSCLFLCSSFA